MIGSGNRRLQRSWVADGGAMTIWPAKSALAPVVAGRMSPRRMPWRSYSAFSRSSAPWT